VIASTTVGSDGDGLALTTPPFHRHLAFKAWPLAEDDGEE